MTARIKGRGERRQATIWMADLCGYTHLNELIDPEEVAVLMERIEQEAIRIVEEHAGIINQFVGDEIVALFGVPTAHEDDERRAVSSARELHYFVRQIGAEVRAKLPQELALHTGVHSGLILAEARDSLHGRYMLRGDTINIAARLRSMAAPDEILVSEATQRQVAPFYFTEPCAAERLRGRDGPVASFRVTGSTGAASAFEVAERQGLLRLVGRVRELEALMERFERAAAGAGQVVAVSGRSGVGKSRLLHELRSRIAPRAMVFLSRCESFGRVAPYQAFLRPLRQVLSLSDGLGAGASEAAETTLRGMGLDEHVPALLTLLGMTAPAATMAPPRGEKLRDEILRALVALFTGLARRGTVALLLEDWHAADEGSITAVAHLAAAATNHPILVVLTHRPVDTIGWGLSMATTIELAPLTAAETAELAGAVVRGREVPRWLATAIHQHTGGNAFFVEQVCRALAESNWDAPGMIPTNGAVRLPVPDTVQAVLRARIDALAPADAETLRLASVLGPAFPLWQLELLASSAAGAGSDGDLRACMQRLAAADLIHLDESPEVAAYRFKHTITQEVAYETLLRQRRRELHASAGARIEQAASEALEEQCEALAYHFAVGEEHERAAIYAERAGDKAARTFSLEEARRQYRQALTSLDALAPTSEHRRRRIDVVLKWAAACMFRPAREQLGVLRVSLEDARRLDHQPGIAYTLSWLGCIMYALGDQDSAAVTFRECMALAETLGDERLLAQVHLNLGQSHAVATDYPRALEHLNEGLSRRKPRRSLHPLPERHRRGVPPGSGLAYALGYVGLIYGDLGRFDDAHLYLADAFHIIESSGSKALEGSILTQQALVQLWQGDWDACRLSAAKMRATAEQIHGPYILAMSQTVTGYADVMAGTVGEGLELLRAAVRWLESAQIGLTLSWNRACLAEALAIAGHMSEAREQAWRALERRASKDLLGEVAAHRTLGLAEGNEDGQWPEARGHFESALAVARRKGSPRDVAVTQFWAASVAVSFGEHELATSWLHEAVPQLEAMNVRWYGARASGLLGRLGGAALPPH